MPDTERRCPHCMRILGTRRGTCPFCGQSTDLSGQDENALPAGTLLAGRYLLGALKASGAAGFLYVAWDLHISSRVAVKELFPKAAAVRLPDGSAALREDGPLRSEQLRDASGEEASCMAAVRGTGGVPAVMDRFAENGTYYLVMTYEEGTPLPEELKLRGGRLSPQEAAALLLPAAETLERLHAQGWIHRDLSPDNLLADTDGRAVLLDLGAGENLCGASRGVWSVNAGFSPPEQYEREGRTGVWTDIYAAGALLFYCIYGTAPPSAETRKEGTDLYGGIRPHGGRADRIIRKAMAVDPGSRYESMHAFAEDLQGLIGTERTSRVRRMLPAGAVVAAAVCVLSLQAAAPEAKMSGQIPQSSVSGPAETREGDLLTGRSGTYTIRACTDGQYVWAVSQDPQEPAHPLILWTQVWDETQCFRLEEIRDGVYRILADSEEGALALTYSKEGGSLSFSVPAETDAQAFRLVEGGEGTVLLQTGTGEVIGIPEEHTCAGVLLGAAPYDSFGRTEAVHWIME